MQLPRYWKQLHWCAKEGTCMTMNRLPYLPMCPPFERFKFHAYYAGGLLFLARRILQKRIKPNTKMAEIAFSCTTCAACQEICGEIPTVEIIEALRNDLVEAGFLLPTHKKVEESIAKKYNPYGGNHEKRFAWLTEPPPNRTDVVYFVGCSTAYRTPEIAQAVVKVLKAAGVNITVMGPDEWCCGEPLLRMEQPSLAKKMIAHNVEALRATGAKTVVFSCPHCYTTLKGKTDLETVHITDYINSLIKTGRLKLGELAEKVTYHDPCYLGRHAKVYDPPRELLSEIKAELVEMPRNREQAWCCVAGGGVEYAYPEYAKWTATQRIEEAEETRAKSIVTACSHCKINLSKAGEKKLKIVDITELIAEATK